MGECHSMLLFDVNGLDTGGSGASIVCGPQMEEYYIQAGGSTEE